MWPQPLHPDLPHLPCIRATPKGDVEDLLFGDAGEDVFLLIRTDGLTGLGSVDNKLLGGLLDFVCQCDAREQQLSLEEQNISQTAKQREICCGNKMDIQSFLYRLRCLPSTWLTDGSADNTSSAKNTFGMGCPAKVLGGVFASDGTSADPCI